MSLEIHNGHVVHGNLYGEKGNLICYHRDRVPMSSLLERYNELLYQVAEVIPGQTRHETALARLKAYNNRPSPAAEVAHHHV